MGYNAPALTPEALMSSRPYCSASLSSMSARSTRKVVRPGVAACKLTVAVAGRDTDPASPQLSLAEREPAAGVALREPNGWKRNSILGCRGVRGHTRQSSAKALCVLAYGDPWIGKRE